MYDHARFFAVTGQRVDEVSREVEDRQAAIDALYAEVFGEAPAAAPETAEPTAKDGGDAAPVFTDDQIIGFASSKRRMKSGEKFAALFAGRWNDYFNSASEADGSVCFTLAYYTKDAAQIDRIFRRSGLFREKWDESRGEQTYGQLTIASALKHVTKQYKTRAQRKAEARATNAFRPDGGPFPPLYRADEIARLFLERNGRMIYWRGVFHLYVGTHYRGLTEAELGARIAKYISDVRVWARPAVKYKDGYEIGSLPHPEHDALMIVIEEVVPTTHQVREVLLQLKKDFLPDVVEAPCWIAGAGSVEPAELVACRNGLLHLPTGRMQAHSHGLFSLNAVDYDYAPSAPAPGQWLEFLHDLFVDDLQCVETLQELFGYSRGKRSLLEMGG